ncbi:MAG: CBS and ACT domain-containing protein [Bacillota bacterium]
MLVRDRMTRNPTTVTPETSVPDALEIMKQNGVRRLPVVKNGVLVGIVTQMDLLRASPSPATTLAVWEIPGLVAKIKVQDVMTKTVHTIGPDEPIEDAALIMRQYKIGGVPVMQGDQLVGIITETDIFDAFVDMLGVRQGGARITLEIEDRVGVLAEITGLIKELGMNIVSLVTLPLEGGIAKATLRLKGTAMAQLVETLKQRGYKVLHVFPNDHSDAG